MVEISEHFVHPFRFRSYNISARHFVYRAFLVERGRYIDVLENRGGGDSCPGWFSGSLFIRN